MMVSNTSVAVLAVLFIFAATTSSFQVPYTPAKTPRSTISSSSRFLEDKKDSVIELADEEDEASAPKIAKQVAPFLSQGEVSEDAMEMDLSDPKQARVMFYIVLSLLPVLFLVPLMLGSREMIPAEMLPPVELN